MKKIITLLVAYLCLSVSTHAQAQDAPITQQVTLHVATAGTLPDIIAPSRRPLITNLKLTGQLNGTDLRLIREMAGADVKGNPTQGYALESLDLSEAEIVSGGEAYCVWTELSSPIRPGDEPQILWIKNYYTKEGLDALFSSCKNLKNVKLPNHSALGNVTDLYRAFYGCTNLTHVDIPEGVTSLGSTFYGCTSLTQVNIPESVTSLSHTFEGCTSLTHVDIPDSVTKLSHTFEGCTSLTQVNIPESVTSLSSTFEGCTSLTNVDIPDRVTSLSETFYGCTSLTHVDIPDSVTDLYGTFSGCTSLTQVNIPESVTSLSRTFEGCTSLTHVDIPQSVTSLGSTFSGCTSLTHVDIPDSVTYLYRTFSGCTSLTHVDIPDRVTSLSETFYGCTSLTHVDIPDSVTNLGSTFSGCTSLTHVDIPEGVTYLYRTFKGCTSLTSVNFLGKSPLPLDEFGFKDTFRDCPNLQAIRFFSPVPLIPSIYPGISNDVIVYIPKGSYMSYWLTTWGDYNLVEFDATDIDTPIRTDKAGAREHYSINGKRLSAPQQGLNIIREADGTTKKILIQ